MEIKWILAIALEATFWIMLAAFLVLRYRYGVEGVTRLFVIGVVLDTAGFVALGAWDYASTGHLNAYTLVIAGLVLYGLTLGKRDMRRLDAWMRRRFARRARPAGGRACPDRSGGLLHQAPLRERSAPASPRRSAPR
jgi:hypothetical protein